MADTQDDLMLSERAAGGVRFTRPRRYLNRMLIFLAAVVVVAAFLARPLAGIFMANPALNGMILAVLAVGIAYVFRQVLTLRPALDWIEGYRRVRESLAGLPAPPAMLAPMAAMLGDRGHRTSLSALSTRSLLDSIYARLDETREISRYLIGLLIFLGLLGTFWGLLGTIGAIGETIRTLSVGSGDVGVIFEDLKSGLEAPLAGMGTAFASSLFGLGGSLVLGFLELSAAQAQNRFYNELEEWLSGLTRLSSGVALGEGEGSAPAYIAALLEQTAENLEELQRTIGRAEEGRGAANESLAALADRLATLTDQMQTEQALMRRLAESQRDLRPVLDRLVESLEQDEAQGALDQASRQHLRNIDVHLSRLAEETAAGRDTLLAELRSELKTLTRTVASLGSTRSG